MKYLFTLFFGIVLIGSAAGQGLKTEKCKWQECKLIAYTDDLPQTLTVTGIQYIHTGRRVTELSELTDQEVNKIKKAARSFKSCTVYVDFDHLLVDQKLNSELSDADLSCLIVLDRVEKMEKKDIER